MLSWLLFGYAYALECAIDPSLMFVGSQEEGFLPDVFLRSGDIWIQQRAIHPPDTLKAHAQVEGVAEGERLLVHWESSLDGVLQSQELAGYSQLWVSGLQIGVHRLTLRIKNQGGEECHDSLSRNFLGVSSRKKKAVISHAENCD